MNMNMNNETNQLITLITRLLIGNIRVQIYALENINIYLY